MLRFQISIMVQQTRKEKKSPKAERHHHNIMRLQQELTKKRTKEVKERNRALVFTW